MHCSSKIKCEVSNKKRYDFKTVLHIHSWERESERERARKGEKIEQSVCMAVRNGDRDGKQRETVRFYFECHQNPNWFYSPCHLISLKFVSHFLVHWTAPFRFEFFIFVTFFGILLSWFAVLLRQKGEKSIGQTYKNAFLLLRESVCVCMCHFSSADKIIRNKIGLNEQRN